MNAKKYACKNCELAFARYKCSTHFYEKMAKKNYILPIKCAHQTIYGLCVCVCLRLVEYEQILARFIRDFI